MNLIFLGFLTCFCNKTDGDEWSSKQNLFQTVTDYYTELSKEDKRKERTLLKDKLYDGVKKIVSDDRMKNHNSIC